MRFQPGCWHSGGSRSQMDRHAERSGNPPVHLLPSSSMSNEDSTAPLLPPRSVDADAAETAAAHEHDAVAATTSPPHVDGYELLGWLARGGMGTVWRAVQLSTQRQVALKLMRWVVEDSARAQRRFE